MKSVTNPAPRADLPGLKLAKHIDVDMDTERVSIDGVDLGYYLARQPITVVLDADTLPTVTFTLLAERLTVTDSRKDTADVDDDVRS